MDCYVRVFSSIEFVALPVHLGLTPTTKLALKIERFLRKVDSIGPIDSPYIYCVQQIGKSHARKISKRTYLFCWNLDNQMRLPLGNSSFEEIIIPLQRAFSYLDASKPRLMSIRAPRIHSISLENLRHRRWLRNDQAPSKKLSIFSESPHHLR